MPVRSLNSSVLAWPEAAAVTEALARWFERVCRERPDVLAAGYFGSYAAGRPGPGSDLDVVLIVEHSDTPAVRRSAEWDLAELPVPADVRVYTRHEWKALPAASRLRRVYEQETVWLKGRDFALREASR